MPEETETPITVYITTDALVKGIICTNAFKVKNIPGAIRTKGGKYYQRSAYCEILEQALVRAELLKRRKIDFHAKQILALKEKVFTELDVKDLR